MNDRITYDELKDLVIYKNGLLFWNSQSRWSKFWRPHKKLAGGDIKTPKIRINGEYYQKTHVIFFLHHQRWPFCIKYKDGNKLNRRIENLVESNVGRKSCRFRKNETECIA